MWHSHLPLQGNETTLLDVAFVIPVILVLSFGLLEICRFCGTSQHIFCVQTYTNSKAVALLKSVGFANVQIKDIATGTGRLLELSGLFFSP